MHEKSVGAWRVREGNESKHLLLFVCFSHSYSLLVAGRDGNWVSCQALASFVFKTFYFILSLSSLSRRRHFSRLKCFPPVVALLMTRVVNWNYKFCALV